MKLYRIFLSFALLSGAVAPYSMKAMNGAAIVSYKKQAALLSGAMVFSFCLEGIIADWLKQISRQPEDMQQLPKVQHTKQMLTYAHKCMFGLGLLSFFGTCGCWTMAWGRSNADRIHAPHWANQNRQLQQLQNNDGNEQRNMNQIYHEQQEREELDQRAQQLRERQQNLAQQRRELQARQRALEGREPVPAH